VTDGAPGERVVLVTGAGRGIGRAIAVRMAAGGWRVAVNSLTSESADTVAAEIDAARGRATAVPGDVSDPTQVERMFKDVETRCGRLDVLVNNAGVFQPNRLLDTPDKMWRDVMAVNLDSLFYCSKAAARFMIAAGGGRIINVGSVAGSRISRLGNGAYCVAKGAVPHLTRMFALELAEHRITVNAVSPGPVATDQFRESARVMGKTLDEIAQQGAPERYRQRIPNGRLARPEDVANLVWYLAAEATDHLTGQDIIVDGGESLP
jgi:NAD(P)-dependent dehydrogenase (short-subunit alcohol dehydrogenase family)